MDIEANFERYLSLVNSITRPTFKKDAFISMLHKSDFAIAPASTKYHNNIPGGLCAHCLNVYDNLVKLVEMKNVTVKDPDTLIILALFHDLGKINYYTKGYRNVKKYCTEEEFKADPKGYKAFDDVGNYKWVAEEYYTVENEENRLIFGSHEETCEYVARCYISLTREESVAILHHTGGMSYDSSKDSPAVFFRTYPISVLLYEADLLATIFDEVVL